MSKSLQKLRESFDDELFTRTSNNEPHEWLRRLIVSIMSELDTVDNGNS